LGPVGIDILAQQLANTINSTLGPDARFDLIGFSMGGLAARHYLQNLGGHRRVERYISIAAPHHGTAMAYLWPLAGARQMRFGSGFLRELDAGSEMLYRLKVTAIWTPLDLMIIPAASSRLAFAREYKINLPAHPLMVGSKKVFRIVEQELLH
jgi:triacylglycerol lipase